MSDTTITKVASAGAPKGEKGQLLLASGTRVAMRMWDKEAPTSSKTPHSHDYEVVGYAISGKAELTIAGQTITLEPGDSWVVPPNAEHNYTILETFTAIEASAPPARDHG